MNRSAGALRAVAVVLILGVTAACSSSESADQSTTTVATTVAAPSTTSTTTTVPLTPAGGTYGIGRVDLTLVDDTRGTDADPGSEAPATDDRTLETVLLYPTADPDSNEPDQPVADGVFPLVVFSHGVTASGPAYVGVLQHVVAAGYVVALPTFPLTSGPGGWGNISQTINQPADVSFILDELLDRAAGDDDLLAGHLSPDSVAVGGHSLGAITSMLFYNTCCQDDRVRAVVAVSGITFPGRDDADNYDDAPTDVPLLLLHGEEDTTLRYDVGSQQIYGETLSTVPRALISFPDVGHVDILGAPSFMPSIIAFLDLNLRGHTEAWQGLGKLIADNGDATIEVDGGLDEPTP